MITPAFDLSQDPEYLVLSIRVPYTRTSEFDLYIDGTDFKFYAKPYFLRLTLPGRIVEDGREKAAFDISKGLFTLKVPKETTGEHFEGLKMLTSLLAPKGSCSAKPLVEEVSAACSGSAGDDEEDEEFDWQVEQKVHTESSDTELGSMQKYGFGNQRSGVFTRLQEELSDVVDIKNPEEASAAERRQARLQAETSAFSPDHYLADLFGDDEIQRLLMFKPWWVELSPSTDQGGGAAASFTSDEKEQLRKFCNRSYLLDKTSCYQVWLSLVDILLAYSYEARSTEGEHHVESAWTLRKLSGTLCWLETYSSLQEVLVSFGRRVLCYPLYRHFSMVSAAVSDTSLILQSGKVCVLKCLLDIHRVFRENDPAYILNDLYITDYCIWIQRVKSRKVTSLASAVQKASLQKRDLELELEELEEAAAMVAEEEGEQGASSDSSISRDSDSSSSDSSSSDSSSSDSSDESEEYEAGGHGAVKSNQGGGAGGGERDNDSTLQALPTHIATPTPQEQVQRKADSRSAHPVSSSPLIQELEELTICQPQRSHSCCKPQTDHAHPVSAAGQSEELSTSSSTDHAHPVSTAGQSEELSTSSSTDSAHPANTAGHAHPASTAGHAHPVTTASSFLELSPRRNLLLLVQPEEDLD